MTVGRRTRMRSAIVLVALACGVVGCSSSTAKPADKPSSPTGATTSTSTTRASGITSTTRRPKPVTIDPCADLTAELVSSLVGFPVEGDGTSTDNGNGFRSCQFKAPLDANPTAGATVIIGAEPAAKLSEIRSTLRAMAPDNAPVKIDIGDGGYLQADPGFAELRVNAHDVQIEVNIITPMDRSIDLGPLATKVATRVVANLS